MTQVRKTWTNFKRNKINQIHSKHANKRLIEIGVNRKG